MSAHCDGPDFVHAVVIVIVLLALLFIVTYCYAAHALFCSSSFSRCIVLRFIIVHTSSAALCKLQVARAQSKLRVKLGNA